MKSNFLLGGSEGPRVREDDLPRAVKLSQFFIRPICSFCFFLYTEIYFFLNSFSTRSPAHSLVRVPTVFTLRRSMNSPGKLLPSLQASKAPWASTLCIHGIYVYVWIGVLVCYKLESIRRLTVLTLVSGSAVHWIRAIFISHLAVIDNVFFGNDMRLIEWKESANEPLFFSSDLGANYRANFLSHEYHPRGSGDESDKTYFVESVAYLSFPFRKHFFPQPFIVSFQPLRYRDSQIFFSCFLYIYGAELRLPFLHRLYISVHYFYSMRYMASQDSKVLDSWGPCLSGMALWFGSSYLRYKRYRTTHARAFISSVLVTSIVKKTFDQASRPTSMKRFVPIRQIQDSDTPGFGTWFISALLAAFIRATSRISFFLSFISIVRYHVFSKLPLWYGGFLKCLFCCHLSRQ